MNKFLFYSPICSSIGGYYYDWHKSNPTVDDNTLGKLMIKYGNKSRWVRKIRNQMINQNYIPLIKSVRSINKKDKFDPWIYNSCIDRRSHWKRKPLPQHNCHTFFALRRHMDAAEIKAGNGGKIEWTNTMEKRNGYESIRIYRTTKISIHTGKIHNNMSVACFAIKKTINIQNCINSREEPIKHLSINYNYTIDNHIIIFPRHTLECLQVINVNFVILIKLLMNSLERNITFKNLKLIYTHTLPRYSNMAFASRETIIDTIAPSIQSGEKLKTIINQFITYDSVSKDKAIGRLFVDPIGFNPEVEITIHDLLKKNIQKYNFSRFIVDEIENADSLSIIPHVEHIILHNYASNINTTEAFFYEQCILFLRTFVKNDTILKIKSLKKYI